VSMCMLPLLSSSGGEVIPRQHQPARKQTKPAAGSRPVARVRTYTYARAQQRRGESQYTRIGGRDDKDRMDPCVRAPRAPRQISRVGERPRPGRETKRSTYARGSTRGGRGLFQLHRSVACACMVASLGIPGARARIACSWVGKLVWLPVFRGPLLNYNTTHG
jgi:hypothetical protein